MTRLLLAIACLGLLVAAIAANTAGAAAVAESLGNVAFFAVVLLCAIAAFGRSYRAGKPLRVTLVAADDLSKHSGYAYRVDHLRRTIEELGHRAVVVGYASQESVIASRCVRARTVAGRIAPLVTGLFLPADAILITSVGALYNGWYAWVQRLIGRYVLYDAQDPVVEILAELHAGNRWMALALPYVGFLQRLVDRASTAAFTAGVMEREMMREQGWRTRLLMFYNIHDRAAQSAPREALPRRAGWEGATVVVYAGGFQRWRGIEAQIDAVALARSRGADVRLLLVGFGDREGFEASAAALIRDDAAAVLGDMPYRRLMQVLDGCDTAVSSETVRYGMQSKLFDYTAAGVRILAIDDGRDLIGRFEGLVTPYDGSVEGLSTLLAGRARRLDDAERQQARELLDRLVAESHASVATALDLVIRALEAS